MNVLSLTGPQYIMLKHLPITYNPQNIVSASKAAAKITIAVSSCTDAPKIGLDAN